MLKATGSRRKPRPENTNYWMSYSDMMAALLLMFVLLLFLSFNRYTSLQETRQAENIEKEAKLLEQEAKLSEQERQLALSQGSIDAKNRELSLLQTELQDRGAELVASEEELTLAQAQLIVQQADIDEKQRLLALSQEEVQAAREQLDAYSKDLSDREVLLSAKDMELLSERLRVADLETLLAGQAAQIDELVGVRARIIEQLRDAFAREGLNIAVDPSGAIRMDSTVFFDTGKYSLKEDGRQFLRQILPVYYRTLMSLENAEFVSEIIIEGHTDSVGSYENNLDLSQRRAQAVVNFCLGAEFTELTDAEKESLRAIVTANGRSKSQLILDENGIEDRAASRRVEIKFRLKDAEMVESMAKILSSIAGE